MGSPASGTPSRLTRQRKAHHACGRAAQRYRITIDQLAYDGLCEAIDQGLATYVVTQEPGREVWDVIYQGRKLRAVWDTAMRLIVTFLPLFGVPGQKAFTHPAHGHRRVR